MSQIDFCACRPWDGLPFAIATDYFGKLFPPAHPGKGFLRCRKLHKNEIKVGQWNSHDEMERQLVGQGVPPDIERPFPVDGTPALHPSVLYQSLQGFGFSDDFTWKGPGERARLGRTATRPRGAIGKIRPEAARSSPSRARGAPDGTRGRARSPGPGAAAPLSKSTQLLVLACTPTLLDHGILPDSVGQKLSLDDNISAR